MTNRLNCPKCGNDDFIHERCQQVIATGFDFEPLPNGNVLIQFFEDDGIVFNAQIITKECLARIPVVVHAFFLAVDKGSDEALEFLNTEEGQP